MNGTAGQIESVDAPRPAPAPKNTAATMSAQTADTTGKTSSDRSPLTTAQLSFVRVQPRPIRPMSWGDRTRHGGRTSQNDEGPRRTGGLRTTVGCGTRYLLARSWVG